MAELSGPERMVHSPKVTNLLGYNLVRRREDDGKGMRGKRSLRMELRWMEVKKFRARSSFTF